MNWGETLGNPVVIGGGVILGLVLLAGRGGGGSSGPTLDPNLAVSSATQYNIVARNAQTAEARISVDLAKSRFEHDVVSQAKVLDYARATFDNIQVTERARITSQAGIAQSMIQGNTAILLDQQQNQNRLGLAYVQADVAKRAISADVEKATLQYRAQRNAAKMNLISNVLSSATKIATAAIG